MKRRGFLKAALGAVAGVVGLRRLPAAKPELTMDVITEAHRRVITREYLIPETDELDWGAEVRRFQEFLIEAERIMGPPVIQP